MKAAMRAAVLEQIGKPLRIVWTIIPVLKSGQVLVRMLTAGICGAQLQEIDGIKGNPEHCPHLLGHEGCGINESNGQKVVVHWRKGTGIDADPPNFGMYSEFDELKAGLCTTFSEYTIVSENRVTPISNDVPDDFAALLGCCLSTALSVVEKEADIKIGEDVTVIGCGGLGLAMILAARTRTTATITGVDISPYKRKLVEDLGANFSFKLRPAHVIIDTIGNSHLTSCDRYISLQPGGTQGGGFNPTEDIPRYVRLWRKGMLRDYPKLITHRISLDQINEGIQLMRDGKAGRVMIEMNK